MFSKWPWWIHFCVTIATVTKARRLSRQLGSARSPLFARRQFVFPEHGQIFRRRQARAINRRPEKLMNNTRRRESGHSRRWPMVSIYFRASIRHSTPNGVRWSRQSTSAGTLRRERSLPLTYLHYERLSHSAAHISLPTSPSRRNVRRDAGQIALSISDACSAPTIAFSSSLCIVAAWWSQVRTLANTRRWFFILCISEYVR